LPADVTLPATVVFPVRLSSPVFFSGFVVSTPFSGFAASAFFSGSSSLRFRVLRGSVTSRGPGSGDRSGPEARRGFGLTCARTWSRTRLPGPAGLGDVPRPGQRGPFGAGGAAGVRVDLRAYLVEDPAEHKGALVDVRLALGHGEVGGDVLL
jgi:hypothetical protein